MHTAAFHPAVSRWFQSVFSGPTPCQLDAWRAISRGDATLIAAPTGSGKTLAAFLAVIDRLLRAELDSVRSSGTRVVYVSPLKALSNDIRINLETPLAGIDRELISAGFHGRRLSTAVRTGDTPPAARALMRRQPPDILVTTPESLYILLTSDSGRAMLSTTDTVIVDEIHALAGSKRGSHLMLSMERLQGIVPRPLQRIGLSATQKPIADIGRFLVGIGCGHGSDPTPCTIIDAGHQRHWDIAVQLPESPLQAVASGEQMEEAYDQIAALIATHRTTLVFVNTRRLAERVARALSDRIGAEWIGSHHGSMAKEKRLEAEQRLKAGTLKALVATASLELGIDIGEVDLVCQIGSTKTLATLLQRIGRSGHGLGRIPKGRIFPQTRDELVECAALLDMSRRGELDRTRIPLAPLDVLAQQIVAEVSCREWDEGALFDLFRRADPYRALTRSDFDDVVRMLADGFSLASGRHGAYLHRDGVNHKLRGRRGARLTAVTCGGAIPDSADFDVLLEPTGQVVGTVNEDFAVESLPGNVFQLGNMSWRILRVEQAAVRVADAQGQPPDIPFWLGEGPARSDELSAAVSRIRENVDARCNGGAGDMAAIHDWFDREVGIGANAARQLSEYLYAARLALTRLPTMHQLVLERFFDETGGMQLVLHSPYGSRVNRAWGLALRKRFCRKFNFELQAAATDEAIVISLGPVHSFALADVWKYLSAATVREVLTQALLDAPLFPVRWRWNAGCALAIKRFRNGRKLPPRLQRMYADDLVALIFPDQLACAENIAGAREIPPHPLIKQTLHDCLTDAMDVERLESILRAIDGGEIAVIERELTMPSPLAIEVLNASPYAFLDDAPLEERRTQAVHSRRWLDPNRAAELGELDPEAIARAAMEVWPDPRNADELHDALLITGFIAPREFMQARMTDRESSLAVSGATVQAWFDELHGQGRVVQVTLEESGGVLWLATERWPEAASALSLRPLAQPPMLPPEYSARTWQSAEALVNLVRSRLESLGPQSLPDLMRHCACSADRIRPALGALEHEGTVLRGRFNPGASDDEWCHRRVLARIHRYTLDTLRREIEPVSTATYARFLTDWQYASCGTRRQGPLAIEDVVSLLAGFEAPVSSWETGLLPVRIDGFEPAALDQYCLSGSITWARLRNASGQQPVSHRATPISFLPREELGLWLNFARRGQSSAPSGMLARRVQEFIQHRGASFYQDLESNLAVMPGALEEALGELVAAGIVHADGYSSLRRLIAPGNRRRSRDIPRRQAQADMRAGRWACIAESREPTDEDCTKLAQRLLRRYGVLCKRVLERETVAPPWRDLVGALRRLESRGEIRGGRFIDGVTGEQFTSVDAVGLLRDVRRREPAGELLVLAASDPLNQIGILMPGLRIPATANAKIVLQDGLPVAAQLGKDLRFLAQVDAPLSIRIRDALLGSARTFGDLRRRWDGARGWR